MWVQPSRRLQPPGLPVTADCQRSFAVAPAAPGWRQRLKHVSLGSGTTGLREAVVADWEVVMEEELRAVHPKDVEGFFERLGLLPELRAGDLKCHCCGEPITLETFRAVTRHHGSLKFACRKDLCVRELAGLSDEEVA